MISPFNFCSLIDVSKILIVSDDGSSVLSLSASDSLGASYPGKNLSGFDLYLGDPSLPYRL